jgi:hypothetical protein
MPAKNDRPSRALHWNFDNHLRDRNIPSAIAVFGVKLDYRSVRQDIGKKTGTRKRRFQMPRPLRPSDQVQGVGRSLLI